MTDMRRWPLARQNPWRSLRPNEYGDQFRSMYRWIDRRIAEGRAVVARIEYVALYYAERLRMGELRALGMEEYAEQFEDLSFEELMERSQLPDGDPDYIPIQFTWSEPERLLSRMDLRPYIARVLDKVDGPSFAIEVELRDAGAARAPRRRSTR